MRNINGEEATLGTCDTCGKEKLIYAPNFLDPYTTELEPETPEEEIFCGDWCEDCWDNRKGDI